MTQTALTTSLLKTPLHGWHASAGARLVPFAGWEMPVYYKGITREVQAVRQRAGVFDVSHMGRLEVTGEDAEANLQRLTVNDIAALPPLGGQYTLMLLPSGGVLDDMIVYRRSGGGFLVIVNGSNRLKILDWMEEQSWGDMNVDDVTLSTSLMALQGPLGREVLTKMGVDTLPGRFRVEQAVMQGTRCEISRTGYTGEDGVEIILPAEEAVRAWEEMVRNGAEPCGLGARDTLRLEAAYCLYGHELTEAINPVEAGLGWVLKWDKGDFIGREALLQFGDGGAPHRLVGLEMEERAVPRQEQVVTVEGRQVGQVTSGTYSPTLETSIALAYVDSALDRAGTPVEIIAGDKRRQGKTRKLPFYRSAAF